MSFETYIFCDRDLGSVAEWQREIDALGFTVRLESDRDLRRAKGHLPASWNGYEAGFEFGPIDPVDVLETYDDFDFGGPWAHVYVFYWGSIPACISVPAVAAAYATAVQGLVFETESGRLLWPDEAVRYAHSVEAEWPALRAMLEPPPQG